MRNKWLRTSGLLASSEASPLSRLCLCPLLRSEAVVSLSRASLVPKRVGSTIHRATSSKETQRAKRDGRSLRAEVIFPPTEDAIFWISRN